MSFITLIVAHHFNQILMIWISPQIPPPSPKKINTPKILERMTFIYYITMGKIISFSNCLYLETILYPPPKEKKQAKNYASNR